MQQFLERYEVGETVGVGGERGLEGKCGHFAGQCTSEPTLYAIAAGFAVVKKGRDKRTGDPVAIKVGQEQGLLRKWEACNKPLPLSAVFFSQVVDKSRYAAGDNSLEREIQVLCKVRAAGLTACCVHVRHLQGPDLCWPCLHARWITRTASGSTTCTSRPERCTWLQS